MKRSNIGMLVRLLLVSALLLAATSAIAGPQQPPSPPPIAGPGQPPPPPPPPGASTQDNCGYPNGTAPALSSVVFNESDILYAFGPNVVSTGGKIIAWYTDEHALTLGVREVIVKTASGTATTDYSSSFTAFNSSTMSAVSANPLLVGTTALAGPQAGTDTATYNATYGYLDHGRPIFPALFITDITDYPNSTTGDWQQSGISAFPPNAVYGTWKGAVKTVDQTKTPASITITPDSDPAKNVWSFIPDFPPNGFGSNQGYSAELVWNADSLGLVSGRSYRLQLMLHDGDQNKSGGDSGEGCVQVVTSLIPE